MTNVYWTQFSYDDWTMYVAKTDKGLCYIGSPNKPFSELETWVMKKIPSAHLIENDAHLIPFTKAIKRFINSETKEFNLPLDLIGTTFQKNVWHASTMIPYGETRTYQMIAEEINNPKAVRAVGTAIGANPLLMVVPCHRIIAKSGSLSGFRGGLSMKEFLLQLEQENAS